MYFVEKINFTYMFSHIITSKYRSFKKSIKLRCSLPTQHMSRLSYGFQIILNFLPRLECYELINRKCLLIGNQLSSSIQYSP